MAARGDLNGWWRFGLVVVGLLARLLFRIRVTGAERVSPSGPAIIAANHVSMLDGVALALVTSQRSRRMMRFLVAAEFFSKPTVAWALRLYRQIPLRRGRADSGALDEAVATVRGGALAGIFPEGTVNPDPASGPQRGRSGVGRIALATGAPVIPVGVWGTQDRWPKSGLRLRPLGRTRIGIAYGEPIEARGDAGSADDVQVFTDLVMTGIAKQVAEAKLLAAR
ncbi:MAG: 1-acyl-sn-glycerol-3-phosphate acyltransferase [Actinobacteria bacterium]|nr:1-acyl-sn-glycerol-3-phosphate acyltransferase [Actinomycetota bacterium]